jgi:hypothetical protein
MILTPMAATEVLIKWPIAKNNGLSITGYRVHELTASGGILRTIFDGEGYPGIQEVLVTGLTTSLTYLFGVDAMNGAGTSNRLLGVFVLPLNIGRDPTVIDVSPLSFQVAKTTEIQIQSLHPFTGFPQSIGGDCDPSVEPSCTPGRNFVGYFSNPCQIDSLNGMCVPLDEDNPDYQVPLLGYPLLPSAATDNGDGTYTLPITPSVSGDLDLIIESLTPGELLAMYWDSENFLGNPLQVKIDKSVNFDWNLSPIIGWSTDYVSVRWFGFLVTEFAGVYTFQCEAVGTCSVWVENVAVYESGSDINPEIEFESGSLKPIRIDYSSQTGPSRISLMWTPQGGTSVVVPSSVMYRGSFVRDAPFLIRISAGDTHGPSSNVYGTDEALFEPVTWTPYQIFVQLRDSQGNPINRFDSTDSVHAEFTQLPPDDPSEVTEEWTVNGEAGLDSFTALGVPYNTDIVDGIYLIKYVVRFPGSYRLSVNINGEQAQNSPIIMSVTPRTS